MPTNSLPAPRSALVHDLVGVVAAPTQVWSSQQGDLDPGPSSAQGIFHSDLRVLSRCQFTVDGFLPEYLHTAVSAESASHLGLLRHLGGAADQEPALQLLWERTRTVRPGAVVEAVTITSNVDITLTPTVVMAVEADLAPLDRVKSGKPNAKVQPQLSPGDANVLTWESPGGDLTASLEPVGASRTIVTDSGAEVTWQPVLPPHGAATFSWRMTVDDSGGVVRAAPRSDVLLDLAVAAVELLPADQQADERNVMWLQQSLRDLQALRMSVNDRPEQTFFAAGAPWYLTLFGRDSLWAARLCLPLESPDAFHASNTVDTLKTLAYFQGRRLDTATSEAPGKIMHELRRTEVQFLPPLYYGTIDATPLWVCLFHDAWTRGMSADDTAALLPHLQPALDWMIAYGDPDGDHLLEYIDQSEQGLANQGWKDSNDSVRYHDGTVAEGPIALCEVQGYAYEAALGGATILEAHGHDAARYRTWAAELRRTFHDAFWCRRDGITYPAIALDKDKRPVDALTSNIGHLLGTGLLGPDQELAVADLLVGDSMSSGLGLRTMSSDDAGYDPLSYHCGSVWAHDTAVVITAMRRAGLHDHAEVLVNGLRRAASLFSYRLPELWSGEGTRGVPYPSACRPQAWAAAAGVAALLTTT